MLALALFAVLASCGSDPGSAPVPVTISAPIPAPEATPVPAPVAERPLSLEALRSLADWTALAAASNEHAVARTEVVKIVIDVRGAVHFARSDRYPLHFDFVREVLHDERESDRAAFNARQYRTPQRDYVLASLVRYIDAGAWALELGPADNLEGQALLRAFERVKSNVFFGDALRYHPRSLLHRSRIEGVTIPLLDFDAIMRGVDYAPVTFGEVVARLVVMRSPIVPPDDGSPRILVMREVPAELPPCEGLVTAELQSPLSHVAVLAASRNIPDMVLRSAFADPRIQALDGGFVKLTVSRHGYEIEEASAPTAVSPPPRRSVPVVDETHAELRDLCAALDVTVVGAKAAALSALCREGLAVPRAFVVPFARYRAHVREIAPTSPAQMRVAIEARPIDPALITELGSRARRLGARRVILRSSTNAEDLEGFSGAGLYESVVADPHSDDELTRALHEVWASVWLDRAVAERERVGIVHDDVAMAVLVQAFVEDVRAIGVAITRNPFGDARDGFFVGLEPAGGSVTGNADVLPEQLLLYRHSEPEILTTSARAGSPVLDTRGQRALRDVLARIDALYEPRFSATMNAVDVEIAIDAQGRIWVLQARPYLVR